MKIYEAKSNFINQICKIWLWKSQTGNPGDFGGVLGRFRGSGSYTNILQDGDWHNIIPVVQYQTLRDEIFEQLTGFFEL